jgi:hypothetical protein
LQFIESAVSASDDNCEDGCPHISRMLVIFQSERYFADKQKNDFNSGNKHTNSGRRLRTTQPSLKMSAIRLAAFSNHYTTVIPKSAGLHPIRGIRSAVERSLLDKVSMMDATDTTGTSPFQALYVYATCAVKISLGPPYEPISGGTRVGLLGTKRRVAGST